VFFRSRAGKELTDGDNRKITSSDGGVYALVFSKVQISDGGEYTVTVANNRGELSCTAAIVIQRQCPMLSYILKF